MLDDEDHSALHYAIAEKCLESLDLLLSAGADIEAKDSHGVSAWLYALLWHPKRKLVKTEETKEWHDYLQSNYDKEWQQAIEIFAALLQAEPNLESKDNDGSTALDIARARGSSEHIKMLEEAGAR